MQKILLEMSRQHAPKMREQYHQDTLKIALDLLRTEALKDSTRRTNGHFMNNNKDKSI
jgi:hypothetical protein